MPAEATAKQLSAVSASRNGCICFQGSAANASSEAMQMLAVKRWKCQQKRLHLLTVKRCKSQQKRLHLLYSETLLMPAVKRCKSEQKRPHLLTVKLCKCLQLKTLQMPAQAVAFAYSEALQMPAIGTPAQWKQMYSKVVYVEVRQPPVIKLWYSFGYAKV